MLYFRYSKDFNPRAPCGARLAAVPPDQTAQRFQSTRPMRGATSRACFKPCRIVFQSTRPMRGATLVLGYPLGAEVISIHAPHAGRDKAAAEKMEKGFYFNPRAPCGARLSRDIPSPSTSPFQSTRPMRGATNSSISHLGLTRISIHAPHAGRDRGDRPADGERVNFNPRAPCGARRGRCTGVGQAQAISIHAPHAGRDASAAGQN